MPLRCLLFSTNEEMVQPILPVLADLGIEGEFCGSAIDAVEKISTQLFQIVVTDWDDQPEASFLLKTARDQKAAQRPLTLAIVADETRLPEVLRAGANSILLKPLHADQIRDIIKTASELLRAKQSSTAPQVAHAPTQQELARQGLARAAAATGGLSTSSFPSVAAERNFRAGEFLQPSGSMPGAQFDTESDLQKSLDQVTASEVDALTDLAPVAASVSEVSAKPAERRGDREALTGWASLQERLTRPNIVAEASDASDMSAQPQTSGYDIQAAASPQSHEAIQKDRVLHSGRVAEEVEVHQPVAAGSGRNKLILLGAIAVAIVAITTTPRLRRPVQKTYQHGIGATANWLNPKPAALPKTAPQHDSFGQEGDEYKLPVAENIPDATTDPSQIRVLPVTDPTVKSGKPSEPDASQGQPASGTAVTDQNQPPANQVVEQTPANVAAVAATGESSVARTPSIAPEPRQDYEVPKHAGSATLQNTPFLGSTVASAGAIPSSLRSQIGSMTPEASGAKPVEAAMSSIEPVALPEAVALTLLSQPIDPQYPAAAKAGGQRGTVVLQVLIARDGTVQEAKFMQGSLIFARAAIDAVRQWHFKPYILNGRPVSVLSAITLNFNPPA
jgi:protein TonB